jgi:hypothetical protein
MPTVKPPGRPSTARRERTKKRPQLPQEIELRESAEKGCSRQPTQIKRKFEFDPARNIGEGWPDGIKIPDPDKAIKTAVVVTIVVLCSALIIAVTVRAMVLGNEQRVDRVLSWTGKALAGLIVWATTPANYWQNTTDLLKKTKQVLKRNVFKE